MVDAVTGVMIIALTAAVVLTALGLSRGYRQRAEADRSAAASFSYLLATLPREAGDVEGHVNGFTYNVAIVEEGVREVTFCRLNLSLAHDRLNRTYKLTALRPCAKPTP